MEDIMQPDQKPLSPGDEGPPDAPGVGEDICAACQGTGTVEGERCDVCGGTGKVLQGIGGG
jgi:RecJ-like exonuclease